MAAAGGIAVAVWSDRIVRKRAREEAISRERRGFIAFMESWKHEIGREYMADGGGLEHHERAFKDVISPFIHEAGLIKRDFMPAERKEFEALCITLIGWKHKSIYGTELCQKAQKEMDDIIAFVEKTRL